MRIDLYVQKDLEELISQEADRGRLINQLLRTYYEKSTEPRSEESPRPSNDRQPRVPLPKQAIEEANTPKPKTISERIVEKSAGFCPNGHSIPPGRSRCMGKKCKYS